MQWILLILVVFFSLPASCVFPLDWQNLHEEADKKSLSETLSATERSSDSINDLYLLGLVYLNLHKDNEAKEVFSKILSTDSGIYEAKWGLAEVLRRQHDLEKSIEMINQVLATDAEFSPAYITLAYIKYIQLDFQKATELAYRVLKQGKENVDLSNYTRGYLLVAGSRGMLANSHGLLAKLINGTAVLPNLKKAEKLQPNSAAVLFGLGCFYFLAPTIAGGDKVKALDYLERSIKIDPLFADAYVRLAQIYKGKGDNAKFTAYMAKALAIDPQNELALDFQSKKCRFICFALEK